MFKNYLKRMNIYIDYQGKQLESFVKIWENGFSLECIDYNSYRIDSEYLFLSIYFITWN